MSSTGADEGTEVTPQLCRVFTTITAAGEVLGGLEMSSPGKSVAEGGGVGVLDLFSFLNVPGSSHSADKILIDGVLSVWTATGVHHGSEGVETSPAWSGPTMPTDFK